MEGLAEWGEMMDDLIQQDMGRWVPLMKQINHSKKAEPPLDGQIRIEQMEG